MCVIPTCLSSYATIMAFLNDNTTQTLIILIFSSQVEISFYLLRRLLGVKTSEGGKQAKVHKLAKSEILMVNIGSTASGGKVLAVKQVLKIACFYDIELLIEQPGLN